MSGMLQNLFGPTTVVDNGEVGTSVTLYSEVFDLSDPTSLALRLRAYGVMQDTEIEVQIQSANDPLGHDWVNLGGVATLSGAGVNEVYVGNSSTYKFAGFGRAEIKLTRAGATAGNYGGTIHVACVPRE